MLKIYFNSGALLSNRCSAFFRLLESHCTYFQSHASTNVITRVIKKKRCANSSCPVSVSFSAYPMGVIGGGARYLVPFLQGWPQISVHAGGKIAERHTASGLKGGEYQVSLECYGNNRVAVAKETVKVMYMPYYFKCSWTHNSWTHTHGLVCSVKSFNRIVLAYI
jgi:hypothetical protein